jgi:cytochrome P450
MNGEKYQQQRRLLLPTFTKSAVEGYVGDMIAVMGDVLKEHWRSGETVDIYRHMRTTALRLSSQILFGRLPPGESHDLAELLQNLMTRTFSAGVWMCPFDLPLTAYRRMRRNAEQLESMLRTLIARRRAAPSQHTDLLTTLVTAFDEQSVPMEDGDLIGQAKILFVASFENVACVLSWTAFLLAQHPQVMEELHAELGAVLGGKPPTVEQVEKLPLLDAVVKESMRVLSPVPFLIRKVMQPTVLGGLPVNIDDRVVCSAYMTHHQADLYPQPQRFLPDRWFQIKPTPYEYLPFGAGPRTCIGRMFAMREIKVALAMILQRYRLTVEPDARIDRRMLVMMSPKHGLPMSVHDQDGRFHAVPVRGNIHEMVDLGDHAA